MAGGSPARLAVRRQEVRGMLVSRWQQNELAGGLGIGRPCRAYRRNDKRVGPKRAKAQNAKRVLS